MKTSKNPTVALCTIREVHLYYKNGTSDKEYRVQIQNYGDKRYSVNFEYGRRGGPLKSGTKTPEFVGYGQAMEIYEDLTASKRVKGYSENYPNPEAPLASKAKMQTKIKEDVVHFPDQYPVPAVYEHRGRMFRDDE